jgi:hypothetical protein
MQRFGDFYWSAKLMLVWRSLVGDCWTQTLAVVLL